MASINQPINIKKLLDAQTTSINSNVDTQASATNVEVSNKAIDTQNAVVSDGDITQAKLDSMTVVDGQLDNNVTAINDNTNTAVAAMSVLPRLAPDLTFPSSLVAGGNYSNVTFNSSVALTTALSLTGKFAISYLKFNSILAEAVTVKLTVDGVVIWNDSFICGNPLYLLGGVQNTHGLSSEVIQCNNSLLLELQTATDTSVQLNYIVRAIK